MDIVVTYENAGGPEMVVVRDRKNEIAAQGHTLEKAIEAFAFTFSGQVLLDHKDRLDEIRKFTRIRCLDPHWSGCCDEGEAETDICKWSNEEGCKHPKYPKRKEY